MGRFVFVVLCAFLAAAPGKCNCTPTDKGGSTLGSASGGSPSTAIHGYVDLHTHPMSHLGFGGKAVYGAPDVDILMPAGTLRCNSSAKRAASMTEALESCNSAHGGWGLDNTCGDYVRAAIIRLGLDKDFRGNLPFDQNLHGDHQHAGYPLFPAWPHHSSILHQQMWWEWLKRARDGGLRVMVALTVNSETLAELLNGNAPYDDKSVADLQIDEMKHFVGRHRDFMEIAESAADVRRIAGEGRIAIILGMEVDKLGNFGKPGVPTNEAAVRAEIGRLYAMGIRYVFPIHLIDNAFGGTAVYDMMFNFANKHQNGAFYDVETDRSIGYSVNAVDGAFGLANAAIVGLHATLTGLGELPAPCINDASCLPPPGKVRCCGSYQSILNILRPSPELDVYATIAPGHVNRKGLSTLGAVAIDELMRRGMIIDVDHMSEHALRDTLALARAFRGGYPLVMGHNGVRPPAGSERGAPPDVVESILGAGGMLGIGTAKHTPQTFISEHARVGQLFAPTAYPAGAVALGTDVNGFERLPRNNCTTDLASQSQQFYARFFANSGITTRSAKPAGGGVFDYIVDGGVSHYGLMPEFLFDVKTHRDGDVVHTDLMKSAEYFVTMWSTIEARAAGSTAPRVRPSDAGLGAGPSSGSSSPSSSSSSGSSASSTRTSTCTVQTQPRPCATRADCGSGQWCIQYQCKGPGMRSCSPTSACQAGAACMLFTNGQTSLVSHGQCTSSALSAQPHGACFCVES